MPLILWMRRASIVALTMLAFAAGAALAADGKDATQRAAPAIPATKESVRELVSRLSDAEVRKLLLDHLDRAAAEAPAKARADTGIGGMVGQNAEMMRGRLREIGGALFAYPETLRAVGTKLTEPYGLSGLVLLLGLIAALAVIGWIAEKIYARLVRSYRARLRRTVAATYAANAIRIAMLLLLDAGGLAVFGLAAFGAFLALWGDHELRRTAVVYVLVAVVIVRITIMLGQFVLAPRSAVDRLLPFADAPARTLYRFAVATAVLYGAYLVATTLLQDGGASAASVDVIRVAATLLALALALWVVWRVRTPIANLIQGDGSHGVIVHWLAELWPIIASVYFVAIALGRLRDILAGTFSGKGEGILSLLLIVALPIVDMALCRALAAAAARPRTGDNAAEVEAAPAPGFLASYEPVLRQAIHIVVVVAGLLIFAGIWDLDVFSFAQRNLGGKTSGSLLGICIVVLITYLAWKAAKTAIDRRLRAEGEHGPGHPASRVRTLLPLLRILIAITLVAMATMSVLAALGVDILPLLAGAGVIGIAVGFGSQTLVRDVVSGAFFLMDDAFRMGEYLEIGDIKGVVEKIKLRSLFLRHHRGAVNIVPYGEIKRLRNTSRDWIIMVLDFRLPYDTSLQSVKKIMNQVGAEIAADPELARDLLQPLKFGGVVDTEDSAIVVRAKFMARPEGEPYLIRKAAYTQILKAFRDAGIKFAHKQVTVNVPPSSLRDEASIAAAGAAAQRTTAG